MAVGAVPDRQLVAPPQLTRHAPGPDLPHPVEEGVLLAPWVEGHPAALDRLDRGLRQLLHVAEPLQRDQRLDAVAGAVAMADLVLVGVLALEQAQREQAVDHLLARGGGRQAGELAGLVVHPAVEADHRQLLQLVAAANLEVVGVVAGRDLEHTGAEVGLDVLVGDDRHLAVDDRHDHRPADQVAVAVVGGVDGDRGVGQDGLRPHRCHGEQLGRVLDRIADVVEGVGRVLVAHLEVRDRRGAARAPVHDPVVTVHVALLVQADEHLGHGRHVLGIHGEALVAIVEARAQPLELLDDRRPVLAPPFPHLLDKGFTAEIVAGQALRSQLLLDHVLGGDAGVVGAADPQRLVTLHAAQADQRVLHRAVQGVAHVQLAGDVGRRQRDHERRLAGVRVSAEGVCVDPALELARLDRSRLVLGDRSS